MDTVKEFLKQDFKFLKWVEIITDENQAVKTSAMYILQKDLNFCDVIFVSDKGKKRRVGGISKQVLEEDFPLLDLSNLSEENKALWKQQLGGLNGKIPAHQWDGTFLQFENPDGSFGPGVNLQGEKGEQGPQGLKGENGDKGEQGAKGDVGEKGEDGALSLINFTVDDDMNLHLEIQPNTGLEFSIDENGNLIINN